MSEPDHTREGGDTTADQTTRLERLGDAMDAFLEFKAGADPESAGEFLARHAELRDLLEPMLAQRDDDDDRISTDHALEPGQCLGDYRILQKVGRGGMGTVFEAEQISLHRRVALKLLHEHLAWSPKAIERFRREAAAASGLRHPGIVPIHEVGEWHGRHYFTMEFLEGRPLHEAMRQPRLGVRADCSRAAEAAELVARVADALQHAHDHGLIHRDVKPHNIMVGDDGSVRLLDFGLVKSEELAPDSVTEGFLGTPHYCSPEQATGQTTGPASDVFSLGVVLYELLSGSRPFTGETAREILGKIEIGDFAPLARTAPSAPRDLRTICEKAMERVPAERYATAGEMAADLRRFLRIEPILATPPSSLVRCGKWVRRHRFGVALWTTATLLVVGAPIAYAAHEYRTRLVVEEERQRLDEAEQLAFRGIEQTLAMLVDTLSRQPGPGSRKQPQVDAVVRLCEQFLGMRAIDPLRSMQVADAYCAISDVNLQLNNLDGAMSSCQRGLELLDSAAATHDSKRREELRGRLLRQQLRVRQFMDASGGAEEFARAIAHWRSLVQSPDATRLDVLNYAETLIVRARGLFDVARHKRSAEPLLREALAVLTPERRKDSARAEAAAIRASNALAHVLLETGRVDDAISELKQVIARIGDKAETPLLGVEKTLAIAALGEAYRRTGKPKQAVAELLRAIAAAEELLAEYPGALHLRRAQQRSRVKLAGLWLFSGKADRAETMLRDASNAAAIDTLPGSRANWIDRSMRADIDMQLANAILIRSGGKETEEPRQLFLGVCDELERLSREQPQRLDFLSDIGATYNNLAGIANEEGDHETARDFAVRAIGFQRRALDGAPENRRARRFFGMHQSQLALALANLGEPGPAVAAATEAANHAPKHHPTLRLAATAATIAARVSSDPEHARVAVAALERIADVNVAEARRLVADDRFAYLRGREDFTALRELVNGQ